MEATSRRLASQWFEDDAMAVRTNHFLFPEMQQWALPASINSTARYQRATSLWLAQRSYASIPCCGEIARDRHGKLIHASRGRRSAAGVELLGHRSLSARALIDPWCFAKACVTSAPIRMI